MTFNLHVVSLPHTQTTSEYATCAYTQKVRKFGKMMTEAGHRVTIYSGQQNDSTCAEHVPLLSEEERRGWFGAHDLGQIHPITWNPHEIPWRTMNGRAVDEIGKRRETERDLLLLSGGNCQRHITEGLPGMTACEPFVGYEGIFTQHRAFESSAWMHHVYGLNEIRQGVYTDAVIPNYFDIDEFPEHPRGDGYLLFIGRVTLQKGPHVASQIAAAAGMELVVAGPGVSSVEGDVIHGDYVDCTGWYAGAVGIEERAALFAGARATIVPTLFLEPFGGVAVESMMAGTPVITSDWGAFRETVQPGTGYRFRNMRQAVEAVEACGDLDRDEIRAYAIANYSLEAVAPMFDEWLGRLDDLWADGWYEMTAPANAV